MEYRIEKAFKMNCSIQSSLYLHHSTIKEDSVHLTIHNSDTATYVIDRASVGGQEYVIGMSQIKKGATAGDMKVTSQLCTS